LLHLVSGIDLPTEGEVHIMGQRLGELSEEERTLMRRDRLGFVFQAYNLVPTLTVEENVLLPLELRGDAGPTGRDRVRSLLERIGIANRAYCFPYLFSGGEKQRVAVARALVQKPALVLADEPTGNLDERTGADILDLLHGLGHEEQRTVLVVTHDRDVVARADRVFVLEHGVLTEQNRRAVREETRR
jgi:putative ABC transport system ATP-binding protein